MSAERPLDNPPPPPPLPDPRLDPFTPVKDTEEGVDPGPPPHVNVKPGWKKSEGQLAALFVLVSLVLSVFGIAYAPERVASAYEGIIVVCKTLGPIISGLVVLINYINSRGKITSNGLWANASILNPAVRNPNIVQGDAGKTVLGSLTPDDIFYIRRLIEEADARRDAEK